MAETIIFVCLAFAAFTGGMALGRRPGKRERTSDTPPLTLCSCDHGYGTHAEEKKCAGEIKRADLWYLGEETHWKYVPCPCLRYDGPEPLSSVLLKTWTGPAYLQSLPQQITPTEEEKS